MPSSSSSMHACCLKTVYVGGLMRYVGGLIEACPCVDKYVCGLCDLVLWLINLFCQLDCLW